MYTSVKEDTTSHVIKRVLQKNWKKGSPKELEKGFSKRIRKGVIQKNWKKGSPKSSNFYVKKTFLQTLKSFSNHIDV